MHYTIELLLKEDPYIIQYYHNAKKKWNEILKKNLDIDLDCLANILSSEQIWFEQNCGGRWIGQEIMVIVGITQFYSTKCGFEGENLDNAKAVYNAFSKSFCSLEVKAWADEIAANYDLLEQ